MDILSIVRTAKGTYQAVAEYKKPINFYPHYQTIVIKASGDSIEAAVENIKKYHGGQNANTL